MKLGELLLERMSVSSVETSPRIERRAMAGAYAVMQGKKVWKSNLSTPEEAKAVIAAYDAVKPGHPKLRVVFLTK